MSMTGPIPSNTFIRCALAVFVMLIDKPGSWEKACEVAKKIYADMQE